MRSCNSQKGVRRLPSNRLVSFNTRSGKTNFWIQSSIKRPGALRHYAESHGFITHRGTDNPNGVIDLDAVENYAKTHLHGKTRTRVLQQINWRRRVASFA
jgi:hypothetical protein